MMVAGAMARYARQRRQHMDGRGAVRQEWADVVVGGGCEMKVDGWRVGGLEMTVVWAGLLTPGLNTEGNCSCYTLVGISLTLERAVGRSNDLLKFVDDSAGGCTVDSCVGSPSVSVWHFRHFRHFRTSKPSFGQRDTGRYQIQNTEYRVQGTKYCGLFH